MRKGQPILLGIKSNVLNNQIEILLKIQKLNTDEYIKC